MSWKWTRTPFFSAGRISRNSMFTSLPIFEIWLESMNRMSFFPSLPNSPRGTSWSRPSQSLLSPGTPLRKGVPGLKRLWEGRLQEVPLGEFGKLGKNDILFIDSSHISKIGSDVNMEFLEILPALKKGVLVHFHDIFLPRDYPREV